MTIIAAWLKKARLVALVVTLSLVSLPIGEASASAMPPTVTPPPPSQSSGDRLERVWTKEQQIYQRLGAFFDNVDTQISRGQSLVDRAKANGKDVSTVQAALDAFSEAVKQARPIYEGTKGIVSAHAGFDQNGTVTDAVMALQTVRDLGATFKGIHQILVTPRQALRDAIQAFRGANRLAPTPSQPGA
jgi:hypothetical protein